jgi:tetratricopeptide (TPR) repeat protein
VRPKVGSLGALRELGLNKNIIDLETAASEIKQACERRDEHARSPFFFFVGSGISTPSVPLSREVCKECEAIARDRRRTTGPPSDETAVAYSHWLKLAFPHRIDRQQYLQRLIKNAPITHANLRLAHLLIDRQISNIAVTTNFDDLLARALLLFGETPTVCDDPRTVERINPDKPEIQIVHVHGSHWFYDCTNTGDEIASRSRPSAETTLTMAALLDRLLAFRAPLVCGYSGWPNDVFMRALARRLRTALPNNMYWFCFHRDEAVSIQAIFEGHPDLYFVVPKLTEHVGASANDVEPATPSSATSDRKAVLLPAAIFDSLIRSVEARTPPLVGDPLSFYAAQLRLSLPKDDSDGFGDIYAFHTVLERVERGMILERDDFGKRQRNDAELEAMREAVRGARYEEVFAHIESIDIEAAKDEQIEELISIFFSVSEATAEGSSATARQAWAVLFKVWSAAEKRKIDIDGTVYLLVCIRWGNAHYAAREFDDALRMFESGISRCGESPDPLTQRRIAIAINNAGLSLRALSRYSEAVAKHEEVIMRFEKSEDAEVLHNVVSALAFKGIALFHANKFAEAIQSIQEAEQLAGKCHDLPPYERQSLASAEAIKIQANAKLGAVQNPDSNANSPVQGSN